MICNDRAKSLLTSQANGTDGIAAAVLFDMDRAEGYEEMLLNCGREGDAERAEAVLQRYPSLDVNARDRRNGNTALMWAASRGHSKVLEVLLSYGADQTLVNSEKQIALELASPSVQKILLANASSGRKVSNLKLLHAAWAGNFTQVHRLLSENNKEMKVNCVNAEGLTPLLLLARDMSKMERSSEHLPSFRPADVATELLRHGADRQAVEVQSGLTPLHLACSCACKHSVGFIETLLRYGADVGARDRFDFTPLHCAAKIGSTEAIRALIKNSKNKLELDVQGSAGSTPLHLSAMGGHEEAVKLLLKAGANAKCIDDCGQTPIETARNKRIKAILQGKTPPTDTSQPDSQKRSALAPVRAPSRLSRAKSLCGMKDLTLPVATLGLQETSERPHADVARSPSDSSLELWQHPFFLTNAPGCATPAKGSRPGISQGNTQLSLADLSQSAPLAIGPSRPDSGASYLGPRNSYFRRSTPVRSNRGALPIHLPPVITSKSPAFFINRGDQDAQQQSNDGSDPLMICGRGSTRTFVEDLEENITMPSGVVPASPLIASYSFNDDVVIPDTITEADIESARSRATPRSPGKPSDFLPGPVIQVPRRQLKPLHAERRRSVKFSDEDDVSNYVDVRSSLELGSPRLEKKHQRKRSCPEVEGEVKLVTEPDKPSKASDTRKGVGSCGDLSISATEASPPSTTREASTVKTQAPQSSMKKVTVAKLKGPLVPSKPTRTAIKMSPIKGRSISLTDKQQKVDRLKKVASQPVPDPQTPTAQPTKSVRPRRQSKERTPIDGGEPSPRAAMQSSREEIPNSQAKEEVLAPQKAEAPKKEETTARSTAEVVGASGTSAPKGAAAVQATGKGVVNTKKTPISRSRVSDNTTSKAVPKNGAKTAAPQTKVVISTSAVKAANKRKVSAPPGKRRTTTSKKKDVQREASPPVPPAEDGTALISGIGWHVHTTANMDYKSTSPVYGSPRSAVFATKYPVIGKIGSRDNLVQSDDEEEGPFRRGPIDIATPSIPFIEPSSEQLVNVFGEDDPTPRNQDLYDRQLSEVALDRGQEVMPPNQQEASLCPPPLPDLDELAEIECPVFDDDEDEFPFQPSDSDNEPEPRGDTFIDLEDEDEVASNADWNRRVEATDYLDLLRKCSRTDFVRGDRTAPTPASASKARSPSDFSTEGQFEQTWHRDSLRSTIGGTPGDTLKSNVSELSSVTTLDGGKQSDTIDWKRGNLLGRGAFGRVFCGMTARGELIAVKQIELSTDDRSEPEVKKIEDEIELLKTLRHRNIVQFFGTSRTNNLVNIFMEYLPGGSIASLLNRFGVFEERVFCRYTRQILDGVSFLHSMNIIHRDIKGGNLMLMPNGRIKLIDFGCAKRLAQQTSQQQLQISMQGSPYWMAPEVIHETGHGPKSDCWSIGCTVFEMATTKPPWAHMQPYAAIFAIGSGEGPVPALDLTKFSEAACNFVSCCLTRDPNGRPSADELLRHEFVARRMHSRRNTLNTTLNSTD